MDSKIETYLYERDAYNKFTKDAVTRPKSNTYKNVIDYGPSQTKRIIKLRNKRNDDQDRIDNNPSVQKRKYVSGRIDFYNKYKLDNKIGFGQKHESYYNGNFNNRINSKGEYLLDTLYIYEAKTRKEVADIFGINVNDLNNDYKVKSAFRAASFKHHPDRGGNTSRMQDVNDAWNTYKNKSYADNRNNDYSYNGGYNARTWTQKDWEDWKQARRQAHNEETKRMLKRYMQGYAIGVSLVAVYCLFVFLIYKYKNRRKAKQEMDKLSRSGKLKDEMLKNNINPQMTEKEMKNESYYYNGNFNNNINKFNMNNYNKSSYLFETYDEFISRKVKEDQKHYDAGYEDGYETALYSVLEMIEEDASYEEVYESIGEYLEERSIKSHLQRQFVKAIPGKERKDIVNQVKKSLNTHMGSFGNKMTSKLASRTDGKNLTFKDKLSRSKRALGGVAKEINYSRAGNNAGKAIIRRHKEIGDKIKGFIKPLRQQSVSMLSGVGGSK